MAYRWFPRHVPTWLCTSLSAFVLLSVPVIAAEGPTRTERLAADQPAGVRLATARELAQATDAAALDSTAALAAMCREDDQALRKQAVIALGLICHRHRRTCPLVLIEAMGDPDPEVQINAGGVVSLFEDRLPKQAVKPLLDHACDARERVRSDALYSLSHLATGEHRATIVAVLRQATRDRSRLVRGNAVAALWRATNDLPRVVPDWLEQLAAPSADVARGKNVSEEQARDETLKQLFSVAAAEQLRAQGTKHPRVLLTALLAEFTSSRPEIRAAAARVAGATAGLSDATRKVAEELRVEAALNGLLDDPNEDVRNNAAVGLASLRNESE